MPCCFPVSCRPVGPPEVNCRRIVEFTPTPDQYVWTFGGADPVMEVEPGTALRLWTEDAFAGRVTSAGDKPSEVLNPKELNPQTGPFHVTGAEPGDTLAVHIVSLEPARDWAASPTIPLFGALTGTHRTAGQLGRAPCGARV